MKEMFAESFQGVNPNRGLAGSLIDVNREHLASSMTLYFSDIDDGAVAAALPQLMVDRAGYSPAKTRAELKLTSSFDDKRVLPYLLFPFDMRFIYYEERAKLLRGCGFGKIQRLRGELQFGPKRAMQRKLFVTSDSAHRATVRMFGQAAKNAESTASKVHSAAGQTPARRSSISTSCQVPSDNRNMPKASIAQSALPLVESEIRGMGSRAQPVSTGTGSGLSCR